MAAVDDVIEGTAACAVEVEPAEVEAGAELTIRAEITCDPPCDLTGGTLSILDAEGATVASTDFTEFDGTVSRTGEIRVAAPVTLGPTTWRAAFPAHVSDGVSYAEAGAPVEFAVKAHDTNVVVWDVPPAIVRGERFGFKVGVKCSDACPPPGRVIEIRDQDGAVLATGTVGDEPWTGTTALYFTEFELQAPDSEGYVRWTVTTPGNAAEGGTQATSEDPLPYAAGVAAFGVRTVPPAECRILVRAIDAETREPVAGAKVVVHPYRVFTDAQGLAEVRVPKGEYRILVSGTKYFAFQVTGPVTEDTEITADLHVDREPTVEEIWS